MFKQATKEVMKKTHGLYPAPLKIIDSVKNGLESPSTGYARECEVRTEDLSRYKLAHLPILLSLLQY